MRAYMGVHVALLGETLPTDRTRIWLLLSVHRSDMGSKVSFLRKAFSTTFATIVFHAGVNLDVRVYIPFLSKAFTAHLRASTEREEMQFK